jgi:nitrogenase molybdenum-iron protein beta chain
MNTAMKQERAVAINPTRACAPIGSMLATFGIHGAMTINHGSQGCATYPRHQMSRHFREPIELATSSLTEKTTVYGGKENLIEALKNVCERFNPEMISICSTCLSETIGDDVEAVIDEFYSTYPEWEDMPIISVRTPSYVGTHITGFDNFLEVVATRLPNKRLGKGTTNNGKVNIIPGWLNPGDIRELKDLVSQMGVEAIWLTDYSDTLDGGYYIPRPRFPRGGTTLDEIRESSSSMATIALQKYIGGTAAEVYQKRHKVPAHILPLPIGLANTDTFLNTLSEITGQPIPEALEIDRARFLDSIVDTHMFNTGITVAIYGEPDMVAGMVRLVTEMGMKPRFAITSADFSQWGNEMVQLADELGLEDLEAMYKTDLHELHKRVRDNKIDLLIGHSKGKFIAEAEDIPLVRVGFPIEDRFGYHRRNVLGYRGGMYMVDEITNAFLSRKGAVVSNTLMPKDMEVGSSKILPSMMIPEAAASESGNGCGVMNGA